MTQQILNDGELHGIHRGKINNNFTELYSVKIEASQVLTKTNTNVFTPTEDYHPCTKLYADGLKTTWENVYDPQDISADAFDRSNHTGTQNPSTIATDSSSRFVSDDEKSDWNQKEDAIGTKQTGFNLPLGTAVSTISEGNHSHTKADIGIGNVDNTSDVNKPVSTAQQTALDLKADAADLDEVDNTSDLDKPISTATQTALDLKQDISDVPVSRISFYLDSSQTESTRTTAITTAGDRYQIIGIFIIEKLVGFTFSGNIFTYTGPSGSLDYRFSVSQKSLTINLTQHTVLHYKPVEDPEEDDWIEIPMSKQGSYLSTADQAVGIPLSMADLEVNTGDRLKLMVFANKSAIDLIGTHMSGEFVQYA